MRNWLDRLSVLKRPLGLAQVFLFFVLIIAAFHVHVTLLLALTVAQFAQVDSEYRHLFWETRYIESDRIEEDLKKFLIEVPRRLDENAFKSLYRYQFFILAPALRHEIAATLKAAEHLIVSSGMDVDVSFKDGERRTHLRKELESRLRQFSYRRGACFADYPLIQQTIQALGRGERSRISFDCFWDASQQLLNALNRPLNGIFRPLQEYLSVVGRENSSRLWSEDDYQLLFGLHQKLVKRLSLPEVKKGLVTYKAAYSKVRPAEIAQRVTKNFFNSLGFPLAGLAYEKRPRSETHSVGMHYTLSPPHDNRVVVSERDLGTDVYLAALIHETGHAAYDSSVEQAFYPYREPPTEVGFLEPLADLFACLFLEPESLKRQDVPALVSLSKIDEKILRLASPIRNSFDHFIARARYQMLAVKNPTLPLSTLAQKTLEEWPDYFSPESSLRKMPPTRLTQYFTIAELEYLISYPDSYQGYVEGCLLVSGILTHAFGLSAASWQQITRLSQELRGMFALGSSVDTEVLLRRLGVNPKDRQKLIGDAETYLGLD